MYKIFISTFGRKTLKVKGGIPIEVGAEKRNNFLYELHDDKGDNISSENEYYGELTGLYWIWKNCKINDDDIVGFCHYNKCLNISKKKVEKWFANNPSGIITLEPNLIRNHPIKDEVSAWILAISKFGDNYLDSFNKLYNCEAESLGKTCRGGNMFIAKGDVFKQYCKWLFATCKHVRLLVGDKPNVNAYMRRYCAYFGERMLAVYIDANHLPALGVKCRYQKWWLPYVRMVANFLKLDKNSRLYIGLKNRFGYVSQYSSKN